MSSRGQVQHAYRWWLQSVLSVAGTDVASESTDSVRDACTYDSLAVSFQRGECKTAAITKVSIVKQAHATTLCKLVASACANAI